MLAVDTSVLIDLLAAGSFADAAEECLREALSQGPVVACEVVVSEVVSGLGQGQAVADALRDMGIAYSSLALPSALRAGEMQAQYRQRTKARPIATAQLRMVPDFLIGAHALLQCQGLITRDRGFFRDYFKGLTLVVPAL